MLRRQFADLEIAEHMGPELIQPLDDTIRRAIESALILCQGKVGLASRKLGLTPRAIYYHQRKWKQEDERAMVAAAGK